MKLLLRSRAHYAVRKPGMRNSRATMPPSERIAHTGDRVEVIEPVIFVNSELSEAYRQDGPYCVYGGWWEADVQIRSQ